MYYLQDIQSLSDETLIDYHYELAAKRADLLAEAEEWNIHFEALKLVLSERLTHNEYQLLFGKNKYFVQH